MDEQRAGSTQRITGIFVPSPLHSASGPVHSLLLSVICFSWIWRYLIRRKCSHFDTSFERRYVIELLSGCFLACSERLPAMNICIFAGMDICLKHCFFCVNCCVRVRMTMSFVFGNDWRFKFGDICVLSVRVESHFNEPCSKPTWFVLNWVFSRSPSGRYSGPDYNLHYRL